jgi:superfamily I DNA/RNA helicase
MPCPKAAERTPWLRYPLHTAMARTILPPIVTREFQRARLALARAGRRTQVAKLDAIQVQAALREEITAAHLTHHGESRLENAEKLDLGEGYRVVTQFIEHEGNNVRVFWFAGSHDECDAWLERHRGYRYVYDPRDQRIELVPVEVAFREGARLLNPELAPAMLEQPLLRHLSTVDWEMLGVSAVMREELLKLTHVDYASAGVLNTLERLPAALQNVLFDVMVAANEEDLDAIRARLDLFRGARQRATDAQVVEAIGLPVNAEKFLTFSDPEDLQELLAREAWEAWMLFIHPAQREIVDAAFAGPARMRGVSGSGKTSVVLHRARHLARTHGLPVLVVTYTSSLAKLLQHLSDTLCGVERNLITISTAQWLADEVLRRLDPDLLHSLRSELPDQQLRSIRSDALRAAGAVKALVRHRWSHREAEHELDDMLSLVREQYLVGERERFLSDVRVAGSLPADVKAAVVSAAASLEAELARRKTSDGEGLVLHALDAALNNRGKEVDFNRPATIRSPFARCVLVDEAQDLSANELRLLMALTDHRAQDGFFVASDAAQRIFRRNTSLAALGIDIRGRAYVLRKNYRNTRQILHAARLLLEGYDIAELDDDDVKTRIDVDLPAREGGQPEIIRFDTVEEEVRWVASEIERVRREDAGVLGSGVAVLSASKRHREAVDERLRSRGIQTAAIRQDVVASSLPVKISTIESAKGHEFSVVFLVGMNEGVIPSGGETTPELLRDARRFYVALTRARDRVVLTWNRQGSAKASPFLTRMMSGCTQHRLEAGRLTDDARS